MARRKTLPPEKQAEKIFCLFHQSKDCNCVSCVVTEEKLHERIENRLAISRILYKHSNEAEKKEILKTVNKLKENFKDYFNANT